MKFRLAGVVTALLLVATSMAPIANAVDHQDGQTRIRWSTGNMFLSPTNYLEQEFIPVENSAFVDGATFRWTNGFHLDFCWQGSSGLTTTGDKCGFVGVGLGSKNGSNYFGNFDFVLFNGVEVSINKVGNNVWCEKFTTGGYVGETQTFHIGCWRSAILQIGTPYVIRIQWDSFNNAGDSNWWSATLTNKKTNETILIGRIKQVANSYSEPLSSVQSTLYYNGNPMPCDKIPTYDLRVLPPKSGVNSSSFINSLTGSCARGYSGVSSEFVNYYSMRLGGTNPETREPGYIKTPEPTPSATPKVSGSPTPSPSKTIVKPAPPVFSGIKISDNILNINVNLGSNQPDKVYLIAPKLSTNLEEKIFAEIVGNTAEWKIKFDPALLKGNIPMVFISEKDGQTSSETKINYLLPTESTNKKTAVKVPAAPVNITSRIVGVDLLVTAKINSTGINAAESVSLFSSALGINRNKSLKGTVLSNSVIFSIPVTTTILSKRIDLNLFATNQVGNSKTSIGSFAISVPKSPAYKSNNQNIVTVICSKGQLVRTFVSKSCPPGWKVK